MKKVDIAYVAGIVDGEGCIGLNINKIGERGSYRIKISVSNTNEWLCQWLYLSFGGCVSKSQKAGNRKLQWQWFISGNKALSCLNTIYPYLHIKRAQAEIAIKYQSNRCHKRGRRQSVREDNVLAEAQYILMASLNKKGV